MNNQEVWERLGQVKYEDLPDQVVQLANQCILDWFGCATAGSREPLAQILREEFGFRQVAAQQAGRQQQVHQQAEKQQQESRHVQNQDGNSQAGLCTVIGADFKLDARTAALLAGVDGNSLSRQLADLPASKSVGLG